MENQTSTQAVDQHQTQQLVGAAGTFLQGGLTTNTEQGVSLLQQWIDASKENGLTEVHTQLTALHSAVTAGHAGQIRESLLALAHSVHAAVPTTDGETHRGLSAIASGLEHAASGLASA